MGGTFSVRLVKYVGHFEVISIQRPGAELQQRSQTAAEIPSAGINLSLRTCS
jgi:hypothetical protein